MKNIEHSGYGRCTGNYRMQYAFLQITDAEKKLMAIDELLLFDQYLEYAKNDDESIVIDFEQSEKEPLRIVYGAVLIQEGVNPERAMKMTKDLAGCVLLDIEEDRVNVSGYKEIVLYPNLAAESRSIPFAALMQTTHNLHNMNHSITMFPAVSKWKVFECLINRPILLACRDSVKIGELNETNWKSFIEQKKLLFAYMVADMVTNQ